MSLKFKNEAEAETNLTSYSLGKRALIRKGQSKRSVELITNLYLMFRLIISGAIPLLLGMCSWRVKGHIFLYKTGDDIFNEKWDIT